MYLSFYKLREEPFRLTPDPRFLHAAEPHRVALTTLVQGIIARKGFFVLNGPVGTGKTTLLHATLHILSDKVFPNDQLSSALLVNPTLSREEFLEALLEEFEINGAATSKPRRLAALHRLFLDTHKRGGTSVLLVDEAHLLTMDLLEEIRLISNADAYEGKLLQIVLCGQPELLKLLGQPELRSLRQRIAGWCRLRALNAQETCSYIAERLHAAGLRHSSPFAEPSLKEIHCFAQGVPRLINLVCDASLEIGLAKQSSQIGPEIVRAAAVSLGLAKTSTPNPGRGPANSTGADAARTPASATIPNTATT